MKDLFKLFYPIIVIIVGGVLFHLSGYNSGSYMNIFSAWIDAIRHGSLLAIIGLAITLAGIFLFFRRMFFGR